MFEFNHSSALEHEELATLAITELIQTECVVPTDRCPMVCSPLSVELPILRESCGLCRIYPTLTSLSFSKSLSMKAYSPTYAKEGDYFIKFDLKSVCHHDIDPDF